MIYSKATKEKAQNIIDHCTQCRRCMGDCLFLQKYCDDPKQLFTKILDDQVAAVVPFSCLMCGHCTFVCPEQLQLDQAFLSVRQDLMAQSQKEKKLPLKALSSVVFHQKFSTNKWFSAVNLGSKGVQK